MCYASIVIDTNTYYVLMCNSESSTFLRKLEYMVYPPHRGTEISKWGNWHESTAIKYCQYKNQTGIHSPNSS